jgi:hypothetical protein
VRRATSVAGGGGPHLARQNPNGFAGAQASSRPVSRHDGVLALLNIARQSTLKSIPRELERRERSVEPASWGRLGFHLVSPIFQSGVAKRHSAGRGRKRAGRFKGLGRSREVNDDVALGWDMVVAPLAGLEGFVAPVARAYACDARSSPALIFWAFSPRVLEREEVTANELSFAPRRSFHLRPEADKMEGRPQGQQGTKGTKGTKGTQGSQRGEDLGRKRKGLRRRDCRAGGRARGRGEGKG